MGFHVCPSVSKHVVMGLVRLLTHAHVRLGGLAQIALRVYLKSLSICLMYVTVTLPALPHLAILQLVLVHATMGTTALVKHLLVMRKLKQCLFNERITFACLVEISPALLLDVYHGVQHLVRMVHV